MLGSGTAVEIVVDHLAEEAERAAAERGAEIHPAPEGIHLWDAAHKRELIEGAVGRGCDVHQRQSGKDTLEEVFLKTVELGKEARMKVRAFAWNTFNGLLRNKIIILFLRRLGVCDAADDDTPDDVQQWRRHPGAGASAWCWLISGIMTLVSGFGSLLAAWAAADAVASEMKTGTILAVMARPVRRWEFLLGKYLGVQMLRRSTSFSCSP